MMKKSAAVFLCICCVISLVSCSNQNKSELLKESEYVDTATTDNYVLDIFKDYVEIVEYIGKDEEITVIDEYESVPVKSVGNYAFKGLSSIKSVVIPSSVLKIGEYSFSSCKNLEEVEIKNGVTEICPNAFESCVSLKSVTIPNSVKHLGAMAFYGCDSLESVTISSSLSDIGAGAFQYTKWLDSFEDKFIFAGDNVLIAYFGTETEVEIPEKTKQVSAFFENYTLKKVILNEGLLSIGEMCFYDCGVLEEIKLPSTLKSIGNKAFLWCQALKEIDLTPKIETISDEAFSDCAALESIIIPKSVKSVGSQIFQRCDALKDITFENSSLELKNKLFSSRNKTVTIHAQSGSKIEEYCKEQGYNFKES